MSGGAYDHFYDSTELYDPGSGTFTATGSMGWSRYNHTATLLPCGQVLIAGGQTHDPNSYADMLFPASVELYDPATGAFATRGTMGTARYYHTATLLPSGQVLIAGGYNGSDILASAELYWDPAESPITSFTATPANIQQGQSATLNFTFTSGTGVIDSGVGAVTSGVPVTVNPMAATTYTLTVTLPSGGTVQTQTTVTVQDSE
jgi:hypothetical protein